MNPRNQYKMPKEAKKDFLKLEIDDKVKMVDGALEEVYEALEMDGGGMQIMDIEGPNVLISFHGACGSCAISTTGELVYIQNTLQERVDPRIQVRVV